MFLNRLRIHYFVYPILAVLLIRCANPVTPEGGKKDIEPPTVVNSFPPNNCINFQEEGIRVVFDEFIQLKDQNTQITISPPPKTNPDFKVKGKSLVIDLKDSLLRNSTYCINFGSSISDITENNILKNFRFVFSTGVYLDSLSVKGKVSNAFDNTPQKDILAMLYTRTNDTIPIDSLPFHSKPYYIARTDVNGLFNFYNVGNGPLLLFAMKDQNGNGIFDLPNEKIAFYDTLISGNYEPVTTRDTSKMDSLKKAGLSILKDSLNAKKDSIPFYNLRMFEETDSTEKVLKSFLAQKDQVSVFFRFPVHSPQFRPLNFHPDPDWASEEISPGRDSVYLWLKPDSHDSLFMEITDNNKILDTVRISLKDNSLKRKKDKKEPEPVQRISLSSTIHDGKLNPFRKNPGIIFSYPVVRSDFSRILLVCEKDTIHPKAVFTDSIKRILVISQKWKEDKKYRLIFPDSTFFSMNNLTNDSLIVGFKTQMLKDFGSLKINLQAGDFTRYNIVQLLDEKENVLEQKLLQGSGRAFFEYLSPGKYKIKCILDKNHNRRWDTGNYRKKLPPEKVFYFPAVIEVRANWDVEESWNIEKDND
jgi:hypothetical protein